MKQKLCFFISFISIFITSEVFAAKGLVIKLDVSNPAQYLINNNIRVPSGIKAKKAQHHVTIGYIEKNLPDAQMHQLGKQLTQELQRIFFSTTHKHIKFEVEKAAQPFGNNVIALLPVNNTMMTLKNVNATTNNILVKHNLKMNRLTQSNNYKPHMTISTKKTNINTLKRLNNSIYTLKNKRKNKDLFFKLFKFSYTVMK